MNPAAEGVRRVRELLSDPAKWTKGFFARDAAGYSVDPESKEAVCFCLIGAVRAANRGAPVDVRDGIYGALYKALDSHDGLVNFNDRLDRGHADVLGLLDKAFEEASRDAG